MKRKSVRHLFCYFPAVLLALWCAPLAWGSGTVTNCSTEANLNAALSGGGTVTFACGGTITLTSTKVISVNTILNANGYDVTLNGQNGASRTQLFYVNASRSLTLAGLKLVNGLSTNGGAIFNNGTVLATNCIFAFNSATGGDGANGTPGDNHPGSPGVNGLGGAVFSVGTAAFSECRFETNSATGGNGGNGGSAQSAGDKGGNGGLGGDGSGGAVYNAGQLTLLQSQFSGNSTQGGDGGDGGTGNTDDSGNGGAGGRSLGGAVANLGSLTATNCSLDSNDCSGGDGGDGGPEHAGFQVGAGGAGGEASGAGFYNAGTAIVTASTLAFGTAVSGNVGSTPASNDAVDGKNGAGSFGGGVSNVGTNSLVNCTFYGNSVTGGNGGNGSGTLDDGGNGGHGWGGNIFSFKHIFLTNCTVASGAAAGGLGGPAGGGFGSPGANGESRGGNIANSNALFVLHNVILADPTVGNNGYKLTSGSNFTDVGFCLSSDTSVTLNGPGSRTNTNPLLGPPADNGGPTLTMALSSASPCIDGGDTNSCLAADQRGQPRPGGARCDIGAYESKPTVVMLPEQGWAVEGGDAGIITVTRNEGFAPLNVYYSVGGSAVNGTDYLAITNFVTIGEGITAARIVIRALTDGSPENEESLNLTLLANAAYNIGGLSNAVVAISDQVFMDPDKRYFRGTGTFPGYHSFVVPLDFQRGVRLAEIGGNATNLFPGNPWTTNFYHFNATNTAHQTNLTGRLTNQNPIVAFGSRVGGTPLLVNQVYRFGVYAGANTSTNLNQLRLKVYNKANMTVANTVNVFIPPEGQSNSWHTFTTNGYSQMVVANGLTTFITRHADPRWGVSQNHSYLISHKADSTATAYIYEWEVEGANESWLMVLNAAGTNAYSKLYTVEFDARPAWQAVFVHQPHFAGKPLPPDYQGKSTEELLTASTFLASNPPSAALSWTNLDSSPDLRRHPILDQFVADLNRDPIALVNYVFNEIELTDAFGYDDDGNIPEASINPPGVNRSALATYQEGQGSPIEQCALLVYLLRQAGYPAAYSFPADENLKVLDSRLSSILGLQLRGAVDEFSRTHTTNRLIAANYPWVSAYIGTNWVHLFPWMKDYEIVEGFGLYDYMPTNYNNAHKWVRDYVYGKTNLLALSSDDDTPATLFPKYVEQVLLTNAPGLSLDDIGVRVRNRRNNYSRWSDFPKPTVVGSSNVVVENLSSIALTNLSPGLTNIFDTVSVEIYSVTNPGTKVVSGELRMADLHNRKFLAPHEKITTNSHRLILSLAPYRPDLTNEVTFASVDPADPADADILKRLGTTNTLTSTDDSLKIKFVHHRQRSLPLSFVEPNRWDVYPGYGSTRLIESEATLRKGDLAALCFNVGRVSRRMLQVHAEEIWRMEQTLGTNSAATNSISADIYQGTPAYLKGMAYYEKVDRFIQVNERLHKVKNVSSFAAGLAKLRAARNASGQLPNGDIDLTLPTVDMFTQQVGIVGNGSLHPDSGQDSGSTQHDFIVLSAADGSAQEHAVINQFLIQKEAISTVKLLRLAQQRATGGQPGVLLLTKNNYLFEGEKIYPTNGATKLKDHDPQLWAEITNTLTSINGSMEPDYSLVYYTPWPVTNATASYAGMGALILAPHSQAGLISGILNGGAGEKVPAGSFGAANSPKQDLNVDGDGNYSLGLSEATPGSHQAASETPTTFDVPKQQAELEAGVLDVNPTQVTEGQINGAVQDGQAGTYAGTFDDVRDDGTVGDGDARNTNGQDGTVADPVNTSTGEFYVDAVDLTLPGQMPLQVRRNYGSHNLSPNQLGYGWKLNYMPFLAASQGTNFYASEPDGSVLVFIQIGTDLWAPTTTNNPTLNNYTTSGIGSIANRFNARIARVFTNGVNKSYLTNTDGSLRIFEEKSFPLSAGIDRLRPYLTKWFDHRGNFYTFEYGTNSTQPDYGQVRRVLSSSGNLVGFQYDVYGRITQAYALDGRRVTYRYDEHGDLVQVTLPDASEWQFEYQHLNWTTNGVTYRYSTHLLTRELKPDGRALQNEYDSLRRVTNQWATVGADLRLVRNATFRYTNSFSLTNLTALLTGTTTVLDYTNRVLRYFYTNGLIRRITDPLNQSIVQTWYEANETNPPAYPRSLKTATDKRGLVTTFLYDDRGNATNTTVRGDLRGDGDTNATATTLATFTANNLPSKVIDPTGATNLFFYTNHWLLVRTETWPSNAIPAQAITNLFVYHDVTNAGDGTVSYGLRKQEIRAAYSADAATNEWDHDSRGFVTRALRYTGTADPTVTVTNLHNRRGELVERTDAIGRATRFAYDALSRPTQREVFESGQSFPLAWDYSYYNPNGELTWSDGPRFDPEDYVWRDYDGDGRLCVVVRWRSQARNDGTGVEAPAGDDLYSTSFFDYDPFGNQIRSINPRGIVTTNTFDAIGQLISRRVLDTNGTQLTSDGFAYEPGGLVTRATNALGGVSQTLYTSTGKPKFRKNTDGSTNAWRYYENGRIKREIRHNGAYWETTYNDAARSVTRIFYSSANVALATNVTELDRRGNVVRAVDPGGFISTNRFDALDRIKISAGPAIVSISPTNLPSFGGGSGPITSIVQQVSTYLYDSSGKVLTVSNAVGERVVTTRDALDRPVRSEIVASNGTTVRLTSTAYSANHYGVTTTNGSGSSAIVSTTYTDQDGNTVLSVRFLSGEGQGEGGPTEFDRYVFDAAGNRVASQRASRTNSQLTVWTTNGWTYDGLNRVKTATVRDGATTTFSYNASGNLTNRAMPGGLTARATYNNAGQKLTEYDSGTGLNTRTNTYSYYASNSIYAGLLQTRTDGRGVVCTHTYDDWLHAATNTYTGSSNYHNLTTVWKFDARELPTEITESFASTNTGPTITVRRFHNGYRQVTSELISTNGVFAASSSQSWDSGGRRYGLGYSGFGFSFTWRPDGLLASALGHTGGGIYTYNDAGLLVSRTLGSRTTTIASRDGTGRPLSIDTTIGGMSKLAESLTWSGDGLPTAHTLTREDFTDSREYLYADLTRRLVEERLNLDTTARWTNSLVYDKGQAGGPGVLTKGGAASTNLAQWSGNADAFGRAASGTNNVVARTAHGRINGPATITASLDGRPMPVAVLGTGNTTWTNTWRATLEVTPGAHQLIATAKHPSGQFTTNASVWFTNSIGNLSETNTFDPSGNVTQRIWRNPNGTTNRLQTFTWDARGRLFKVSDRLIQRSNTVALATNGVDFTATYDPFGRLLRTVEIVLTNSLALSNQPIVIDRTYDPEVEFLEVAVTENGKTTWKLMGPDMDGRYGGQNGTGGFEAIIPGPELFCPILSDAFGNLHAVYDQTHGSLTWYQSRLTGYGAVPGYRPVTLGTASADLGAKYAWRNRAQTGIGYVWMGGTWLKPDIGETLSFDPYGHDSSDTGHTPFRGNPWKIWDADGRLGADTYEEETSVGTPFGTITHHSYGRSMWSAGILFLDLYDMGPAATREDPLHDALNELFERGGDLAGGAVMTASGFVPWVGDAQDVYAA
jgi:YD repeat-containing protein